MLNVIILWIFSCGIELGVIVLCLLPLRFILRRKVPRLFSYLLWGAVPVNVVFNLCLQCFPRFLRQVEDYLDVTVPKVIDERSFYVLKWIWSIGSIFVLIVMLLSFIRFRLYLIGSVKLKDNIYLCSRIDMAFSIGLFQPQIYLSTIIPEEYREFVIMHEQVHIKRKDIWMKYLGIGLLALFWFQPILWLAYYLFINDMEEACDETVLQMKGEDFRADYAKVLYDLTFEIRKIRGLVLGFGNGAIKERIRHAALYEKESPKVRVMALVVCILFMLTVIPISWQIPRLIQEENRAEVMIEEKGMEELVTKGK